jgi:hypothetical protein
MPGFVAGFSSSIRNVKKGLYEHLSIRVFTVYSKMCVTEANNRRKVQSH